jgi:hypothetical protein
MDLTVAGLRVQDNNKLSLHVRLKMADTKLRFYNDLTKFAQIIFPVDMDNHFLFCYNFPIQRIIKHTKLANRLKSGIFQTLL